MIRIFTLARKAIVRLCRYLTIGNDKPRIMKEAGFSYFWDDKKLWEIKAPVTQMKIEDLSWNLDLPHWEEKLINDWNLTPREVINNPRWHKNHFDKISKVDPTYPLHITKNGLNKWFILDGNHRLAKAFIDGKKSIEVKIIPRDRMSQIKK